MSMARLDPLIPAFFAAAGLVVFSGAMKLRHHGPAGRALGVLRLPSGPWTVRAIGLVEMGIGMWCLAAPGRASAVFLALLYAAFGAFVALLMRVRAPLTSCGCLGNEESPPSLAHVVLDLAAAATAALVASSPPSGVIPFAARLPLGGVPFVTGTVLIAYLAYLAVAHLPLVFWSYGRSAAGSQDDPPGRPFALRPREDG